MKPAPPTILVVDDEPMVRNLVRVILEDAGYLVLEACNGFEALEVVKNYVGDIELVITDFDMPEMDGLALAHKLETDRPTAKILVMSGRDSERFKKVSHKKPFLRKPFSIDGFLTKVKDILQGM